MGTPAGPAPVAGPVDVVLHLAALIPPRADREPEAARLVNIEGTRTLVAAMERRRPAARLVHASSIAVYGDRVNRPLIEEADEPAPNPDDVYANQKLAAEWIVRTSSLDWYILRLSYVVAADALIMDPLLFEMPPETAVEPCPVEDVARAFVSAATMQAVRKRPSARKRSSVRNRPPAQATVESGERERIFLVAGGPGWRIMYRDYLDLMFRAFGLGRNSLPRAAFSDGPFHCGFMDTRRSQAILCYQRRDFGEFMEDLRRSRRLQRLMITAVRPIARAYLISRSPHFRRMLLEAGRPAVGRSAEGRAMNGRTAPAGVRTGTSRRAGMQLRRDIARLVMRLRTSLGLRLRLQKHL
jgi:nucleoside-diphosphate-sugar epimerase